MSDFWQHPWPVTTLVTHEGPHLDELAAIVALQSAGEQSFPGIGSITAQSLVAFNPAVHLDNRTEEDWLQDDQTLFVGVRGGRFDDHPHEHFPNRCALTLVLEHLRLLNDPGWQRVNAEVLREDRNGTKAEFHLAHFVKCVNRCADKGTALSLVRTALSSYLTCQASYQEALHLVRQASTAVVRNRSYNADVTLCWIDGCDNEDFARAARTTRQAGGCEAALVVQRNSRGNVYISSNHYLGVRDLSWLVGKLRLEEQIARDDVEQNNTAELDFDGDGFFWYHHQSAAAAYNGSASYQHVEPTRVSLPTIVELAKRHLERLQFRPEGRGAVQKLRGQR